MYLLRLYISVTMLVACYGVPKVLFRDKSVTEGKVDEGSIHKDVEDYSDEELLQELGDLVDNLTPDQLESLEEILDKEDLDDNSEFKMISEELEDLGMDDDDVHDLRVLTKLMYNYLENVPDIAESLEFTAATDLQDHIQLYLLGLPNNLGPLGYITLHKVLEDVDDEPEVVVSAPNSIPGSTDTVPTQTSSTGSVQTQSSATSAVQSSTSPSSFRRRRHAHQTSPSTVKPQETSPTPKSLPASKAFPPYHQPSSAAKTGFKASAESTRSFKTPEHSHKVMSGN